MSHDPSAALQPQFGAVPGYYQQRMLPHEDIEAAGWPTLKADDAVNFANDGKLMPVRIKKPVWVEPKDAWRIEDPDTGQLIDFKRLYRVWGDWALPNPKWAAWDIGRYWTDEKPPLTEPPALARDDFYGKTAVMLSWNSGRYVAQLVNAGLTEIRGWRGTIAPQPAEGMDPRPVPGPYPGYHLPGGVIQYFIPDALPFILDDHTPWNPRPLEAIPRPDLQVAPPGKGMVADGRHYQALANLVDYLADLLEAASTEAAEFGFPASPPTGQAAILRAHVRDLPAANADSKLIAQSLVPIARYLDGYPKWGNGAIEGAIEDVVRWAYAIGVEAT